jgi:epoxyqueuosine reductase
MIRGLLDEIISHGDRGAVVPFSRIIDLKKDMMILKQGNYHTDWMNRMANHILDDADKFVPANLSFKPRSLISVVMPSHKTKFQFSYRGKLVDCAVPPAQNNFYNNNDRVLRYISDYLSPLGFAIVKAETLPQKLLAVHCGLGLYGRNNICYNDEFGSYAQIMTYLSDLPCEEREWFPIRRMKICETCGACVKACPTKAIDANRMLIDSDKCVTKYNENPGEFPDWLPKDVHSCIVGCMNCQDCCPANSQNKDSVNIGAVFTENETATVTSNMDDSPYPDSIAAKIEASGLLQEFAKPDVFSRNLVAFLQSIIIL